jgi:hypothetical protein
MVANGVWKIENERKGDFFAENFGFCKILPIFALPKGN